jgi:hypothetical protein
MTHSALKYWGSFDRAKAAAAGKQSGTKAGDATRRALHATINKDDIKRGGGWEQFDLNKMNYEEETKGHSLVSTSALRAEANT